MKYFVGCLGPLTDARQSSNNNNNINNNDNNNNNDDDLEVPHPKVVLRLPDSWSNWNLVMLVFEERRKPEYLEKNLSEQRGEPKTNSTHIWRRRCLHCNSLSS